MDINNLADYFSQIHFSIVDVRRAIIEPGRKRCGVVTPPFYGMIFPLRGRAKMSFDGVPYEMKPGKIFHAGPNMALDKEVVGQSNWDFMVIHYQVHSHIQAAFPYALSHYELSPGINSRINDTLHRLYHLCATPGNIAALKAKALFLLLLDEIFTCASCRLQDASCQLTEKAAEYMKNHYMEPLTIPEVAQRYDLSSKQFAYLFQKHKKVSPNEFLIEYRMQRARDLLLTTACPITEISACVGYADPYYFSKLFKQRMGVSPKLFRSNEKPGDQPPRKSFD